MKTLPIALVASALILALSSLTGCAFSGESDPVPASEESSETKTEEKGSTTDQEPKKPVAVPTAAPAASTVAPLGVRDHSI